MRFHLAIPLLLTACGFASEPDAHEASTTEREQAVINACNPRNYPCDPGDPFANNVCAWICGNGSDGAGHCLPYATVDEVWCSTHPDQHLGPGKWCDLWGNPAWDTHCVPGWLP